MPIMVMKDSRTKLISAKVVQSLSHRVFQLSLRASSSRNPETSRRGNWFGIIGMTLAVAVTFFHPQVTARGYGALLAMIVLGGAIGTGLAQMSIGAAVTAACAEDRKFFGLGLLLLALPETILILSLGLALMLLFGVLGYFFKKLDYPIAPMVLAMVLGDRAEEAFRQSLLLSRGDLAIFWGSNLSATLMVISSLLILLPLLANLRRRLAGRPTPY
jgi:F0F1-type ATP synthase membrane subunit c/vacuolar-type H+-ATPase subunit K